MGNCCGSLHERLTHTKSRRRAQAWQMTGVVGLRGEQLKELPPTLRDLAPRLTVLDASINQIRRLPSFLGDFRQLQRLVLSRNELITLPDSISSLVNLKVLWLDFNKISTFPANLGGLTRLEKLYMSSNCLTEIPESLEQLHALKEVEFSDNRIVEIRCNFEQVPNLESLTITNNAVEELPVSLRFCVRLRELHCDRNRIVRVPSEILLECRSLQTLSLDGNPIDRATLESTDGYKEFEKRRQEKASKAISSQVMMGEGTLNEAISRQT